MNIIAFSVDSNYIKYALALVRSIEENDVTAKIVCRGVNLKNKDKNEILNVNNNVEFIDDQIKLSKARVLMKTYNDLSETFWTFKGDVYSLQGLEKVKKTMYSAHAAYACHSRFKTIIELLDTPCDRLMCLDADTIVNKNFDHVWDKTDYDLCVVPSGKKQDLFHNEGMLLINNTDMSRRFFKAIHDKIFDGDKYLEWDADTEILSETYNDIQLEIHKIDKSYKDKLHKPDSYMWSGDGPRKKNKKFRQKL